MRPELHEGVAAILAESRGVTSILSARALGGGSINEAWQLDTDRGPFFVKTNFKDRYPQMFETEARGLRILAEASDLRVPAVIATGTAGGAAFIILEYLESSMPSPRFWHDFGQGLAALHRHTNDSFGLDHDNYIGSLPQSNARHATWPEFFVTCRLEPMWRMAREKGHGDRALGTALERLYARLGTIFPDETPSLLHGDLWSGNFMTGPAGGPAIIDPAVYYGFREMDIGMSKLFGGFSREFYESYHAAWPMEPGWEERLDICNLYPLMVHVNLFGAGYLGQVKAILRRF